MWPTSARWRTVRLTRAHLRRVRTAGLTDGARSALRSITSQPEACRRIHGPPTSWRCTDGDAPSGDAVVPGLALAHAIEAARTTAAREFTAGR